MSTDLKNNNQELRSTLQLKIVAEDKYKPSYANETDACMDLKVKIRADKDEALRCYINKTMSEYP